jgi:hypothetical protein
MEGYVVANPGWMNYSLHTDCYPKPKRIYFRNHGHSYLKHNGEWVRVYFNYYLFNADGQIPMRLNSDGEWEMA